MELTIVLLVLALAFVAEAMTEYLFGWAFDLWEAANPIVARAEPLKYVAAAMGVGLAFAYRLDLIGWAFGVQPSPAWIGVLITGLAIGRGANFVHDFAERYLGVNFNPGA